MGYGRLPGGWADVNESPAESVEREVWEESGYRAKATKLLALWDRSRHGHPPHAFYIYKVVFLCELTGGSPKESMETDGVGFFAEDALPPLSVGRVTRDRRSLRSDLSIMRGAGTCRRTLIGTGSGYARVGSTVYQTENISGGRCCVRLR